MPICPRTFRRKMRCASGRALLVDLFFIILFLFVCSLVASQLGSSTFSSSKFPSESAAKKMNSFEDPPGKMVPIDLDRFAFNRRGGLEDMPRRPTIPEKNDFQKLYINRNVDGIPYPKLSSSGDFIPMRRIVHLDLKGGAFKPGFFDDVFVMLKTFRATGVLIEWEDMFPYSGRLASAINGNAYSKREVEGILKSARRNGLEVIPLVQTFGHLEWILKLENFSHLRDSEIHPQAVCFALEEAWTLIQEMIDEVASIHAKFGMKFFHMGADEVFQVGFCNSSMEAIQRHGTKERAMLWHMARTAGHIRRKYKVSVMAWHDMVAQAFEDDLKLYHVTDLIEPVIWSYAEDLDQYLGTGTWSSLRPFKKVWASSAYKGADGPMRFSSNPLHYIRNNEAWLLQLNANYRNFEYVQGMIMAGWSRYDHLAILCELFPVGIPTLAMVLETVIEGRGLHGNYPYTTQLLKCTPPVDPGFVYGCQFPGRKIYELINELREQREQIHRYIETDHEFNGWLSRVAQVFHVSSPMYIEKVIRFTEFYLAPLQRLEAELRREMSQMFFNETIDEFIFTYLEEDLKFLKERQKAAALLLNKLYFPKRPYIKLAQNSTENSLIP